MKKDTDEDNVADLIREKHSEPSWSYLAKIPSSKFKALEIIRDQYNEGTGHSNPTSINQLINIAIDLLLAKAKEIA